MKNKITILSDHNSWINEFIPKLILDTQNMGHEVSWIHELEAMPKTDILFILSFSKIVPTKILIKHKHNLVVHESNLPKGRGWSPVTWQVLKGKTKIPVTLFEAGTHVDDGKIYIQTDISLTGNELLPEIHKKQAKITGELCLKFIQEYTSVVSKGRSQKGIASYYLRRTPKDSEVDPKKTILEQFNLLRVVDNDRYPAFFYHRGKKYILKILEDSHGQ